MKRIVALGVFLMFLLSFTMPAAAAKKVDESHKSNRNTGPQTYTVLVGAENVHSRISMAAFYPATLKIHVGDTVLWKANSNEIHTITFLAGQAMPDFVVPAPADAPGPLMINPQAGFPIAPSNGQYNGSTYVNSGILSNEPGMATQFSLTFTQAGTFPYVCLVHGKEMSGTIEVVADTESTSSPSSVLKQAQRTARQDLARGRRYYGQALSQVPKPQKNADGTTTYFVNLGFMQGQTMVMSFFPDKLVVHPGDTIVFSLGPQNDAPHTVTFLNGAADIPLVTPIPQPSGPPLLLLNPEVVMPSQPGVPLSHNGIYNSGLLNPGGPGPTSYTLKIGNTSGVFPFECILHDASGMTGVIKVVPAHGHDTKSGED